MIFLKYEIKNPYKEKIITVYKNPSLDEIDKVEENARAFIIKSDLYLFKNSAFVFHYALYSILRLKLCAPKDYFRSLRKTPDIIALQKSLEKNFYLSELYEFDDQARANLLYNIDFELMTKNTLSKNPYVRILKSVIG